MAESLQRLSPFSNLGSPPLRAKRTKSANGEPSEPENKQLKGFPSSPDIPVIYRFRELPNGKGFYDPDKTLVTLSAYLESKEDLVREISEERNLAEIYNAGEAFEEKLPQLLRDSGKIELLEDFFKSSPFPEHFVEGFIKIETENKTLLDTLILLTTYEAETANSLMSFRGTNFCQSVVKSYWARQLVPNLQKVKEEILVHRKSIFSRYDRGKINPGHSQFPQFLHTILKSIHQEFDALPNSFIHLLQIRCRLVAQKFPQEATRVASDIFFLRILNPYLVDSNGVDTETHNDLIQITRGIQKVANGESFAKNEKEALTDFLDTVQMHRDFIKKIVSPHRYFLESGKQELLIKV